MNCTIKASKQQLNNIGCPSYLHECEVVFIKDYPTGYCQVEMERKEIREILGKPLYEYYDIPKQWLECKK